MLAQSASFAASGAPPKPWEQQGTTAPSVLSLVQPDPSAAAVQDSSVVPVNTASGTPSYPLAYNPRFTAPYAGGGFGNGYTPNFYGGGYGYALPQIPDQFLPPNTAMGAAEQRLRAAMGTVGALIRAFGGLAQMLDSTVYAAWSSVMAVVAVVDQLRYLRQEHIQKWLGLLRQALSWLLRALRLSREGRRSSPREAVRDRPSLESVASKGAGLSPLAQNISGLVLPAALAGAAYLVWRSLSSARAEGPVAKAIYKFTATDPSCLDLETGDDVMIRKHQTADHDWVYVRNVKTRLEGFVPLSYIRIVDSRQ